MSLRQETPCDFGECPYNAQYSRDCEYWCGCDEPVDDPDVWDDDPENETTNNNEEEIIMPNNIIVTGKKTVGNFVVEYQQNGYGAIIPVIDGNPQPQLMFGYVSEADLAAGMRLIEDALRATGNNSYDVQRYIMQAMTTAAHDIHPSEAIEVNGEEILISYEARKAYLGTSVIANLDDLNCVLPDEAVRALLVSRTETALAQRGQYNDEYDEWEDEDYDA